MLSHMNQCLLRADEAIELRGYHTARFWMGLAVGAGVSLNHPDLPTMIRALGLITLCGLLEDKRSGA